MSFNCNMIKGSKEATSGTYAEDSVNMPKAEGGMLPAITKITVEHPRLGKMDDKYSAWHLANEEMDDIANLNSIKVLTKRERKSGAKGATTGGSEVEIVQETVEFSAPVVIRSEQLYFGFKQDTGSAHTYRYVIEWVPRKVDKVQQVNEIKVTSAW